MIQTWIAEVTPLLDTETYQYYYEKLPQWRCRKADRLYHVKDRALSVAAWTLYERARKMNGKELIFNLSHSGFYALCSVVLNKGQDIKVGCDIEEIKSEQTRIARRFFTAQEVDYIIKGQPKEEQICRFYRLWVLKESFVKATGEGISLGLQNFEVGFDENDNPKLLHQPKHLKEEYYFKEYSLPETASKIAVCATNKIFAEELIKEKLIR